MIITKGRGSYAKRTGEPVSSDVDRWITIPWPGAKRGSDLIYTVHPRSNGSEQKGGKIAGGDPWLRRSFAGAAQIGDSGSVLGCGLVQKGKSGVRNPLGSRARVRDGRSGVNGGGGGTAWQSIAGDGG